MYPLGMFRIKLIIYLSSQTNQAYVNANTKYEILKSTASQFNVFHINFQILNSGLINCGVTYLQAGMKNFLQHFLRSGKILQNRLFHLVT